MFHFDRPLHKRSTMKIYAFLLSTLFFAGIFQSCSSSRQLPEELADTYYGFLPCADCPGISYTLDLQTNGQYHLTMDYYDRESTFESVGEFTYENDRIMLYADEKITGQYEFEGDKLIHLDGDGNRIMTDLAPYYILYKGNPSKAEMPEELANSLDTSTYIYKGTGNEPFWMVRITQDNSLFFKGLMEKEMEFEVPIDERTVSEDHRIVTYSAKDGLYALDVRIIHQQCQDDMSGFYFPTTLHVILTIDGQEYELNGCGEFTDQHRLNGFWELEKIGDTEMTTVTPTLIVDLADGKIYGNAGCNRYFGSIGNVTTSTIHFTQAGSTKMACPEMSIENQYMELISQDNIAWSISEDGRLTLSGSTGDFEFKRSEKAE